MAKATIANYLIDNLSNRFPFTQSGIIDHDIIDVMVHNWDNQYYPTLDFKPSDSKRAPTVKHTLM